jgi:hypothetical protein
MNTMIGDCTQIKKAAGWLLLCAVVLVAGSAHAREDHSDLRGDGYSHRHEHRGVLRTPGTPPGIVLPPTTDTRPCL